MANRTGTVVTTGLKLHASPNGYVVDELAEGDRLEIWDSLNPGKLNWLSVRVMKAHGTAQIGERGFVAEKGEDGKVFVRIDEERPSPYPPYAPRPPAPPTRSPEASELWSTFHIGAWLAIPGALAIILIYYVWGK